MSYTGTAARRMASVVSLGALYDEGVAPYLVNAVSARRGALPTVRGQNIPLDGLGVRFIMEDDLDQLMVALRNYIVTDRHEAHPVLGANTTITRATLSPGNVNNPNESAAHWLLLNDPLRSGTNTPFVIFLRSYLLQDGTPAVELIHTPINLQDASDITNGRIDVAPQLYAQTPHSITPPWRFRELLGLPQPPRPPEPAPAPGPPWSQHAEKTAMLKGALGIGAVVGALALGASWLSKGSKRARLKRIFG